MSSEPIIELRAVAKSYGATPVLDGVSLTVDRGEVFGYVGPNGAGKTTTIKILTGLIRPTDGDAFVCGTSVLHDSLRTRSLIGYVPESGAVFEKLSPREYLTVVGHLYKLENGAIEAAIGHWLEYFDLASRADQRMDGFSKGMKQKVCLIAALLHDPDVLVLDEPLTGLDVETVVRVKELMAELAASNKTIFYTSHIIDVVEKVCSRIAVLHRGRLIGIGSVDDVRSLTNESSLEGALMSLWKQS